jgi:hypothetical protein
LRWIGWHWRVLVWAKRGVVALERIAAASESTAQIALDRQTRIANARARVRRVPTDDDPIVAFETLDQKAANAEWDRMRAERGEDIQ